MSTRPHPEIVVTANTKPQLETKTWREVAKWHNLSHNRHWFTHTATRFYHNEFPKTWFAACIPWSAERSEAFQGTHEEHVLTIFDEASAIDDPIWEVTEGNMTTPGSLWIAFGNPTKNTGRFSSCFKDDKFRWHTKSVDSRNSKLTNKEEIDRQIQYYGEDSDFVRVHVKGMEPRASATQLISDELALEAADRVIHESGFQHEAKVMGIDVGEGGLDLSTIIKRQGLAAFDLQKYSMNEMEFIRVVKREIDQWQPDGVFIDAIGPGRVVYWNLVESNYQNIYPVKGSERAKNPAEFFNLRSEMYWKMADWLKKGGAIPKDRELRADLTAPEFYYDDNDKFKLERKEDVRAKLGRSPDAADALAMTFADTIHPKGFGPTSKPQFANSKYNILDFNQDLTF